MAVSLIDGVIPGPGEGSVEVAISSLLGATKEIWGGMGIVGVALHPQGADGDKGWEGTTADERWNSRHFRTFVLSSFRGVDTDRTRK